MPHHQVRDRGFTSAISSRGDLEEALAPRRRAILIGVDQYSDTAFPALKHAGADATSLAKVLSRSEGGGFDDVTVLTGLASTSRPAVEAVLREALQSMRREDVLVVYFSGHGTRVRDGDGWRRFLLTSDSRSDHLESSAIDVADLQTVFARLPPARKALVIDACFSGDGKSFVRPGEVAEPLSTRSGPLVPRWVTMGPGDAYLYATSPGRPSREDDRLGHGVYTWFLLEALTDGFAKADLDRDGVMTAWEAHDYARSRTRDWTDGVQVPEAAFRVVGDADVVLAGAPSARKEREQALLYLFPEIDEGMHGAHVQVDGRDRGTLPAAIPIDPGTHHVRIEEPSGRVRVDGELDLERGRTYRADRLDALTRPARYQVGVRGMLSGGAGLAPGGGLEAWMASRSDRERSRGLYAQAGLGVGVAGERWGLGEAADPRASVWATGAVGWQTPPGRLTVAAALGATVWAGPGLAARRDEAARRPIGAAGPVFDAGWHLGAGWQATCTVRPQLGTADLDGDGRASVAPRLAGGIGFSSSW